MSNNWRNNIDNTERQKDEFSWMQRVNQGVAGSGEKSNLSTNKIRRLNYILSSTVNCLKILQMTILRQRFRLELRIRSSDKFH